ncbi:MAG: glycine cleavage system protein R [Gammaproteobacteria bacterium]|nr:MAG: glycine cleavage system protein R [Gammaproteobacteria bacterium]RLA35554.1 MAG: glycine cleavage system protein R [Gammaproteobacteria bacterium]
MTQLIVLSAVGSDRPGVVKDISEAVLACGGNIEESRMAALGAEFAVLLLISGNWHTLTKLEKELDKLKGVEGLTINLKKTGARNDQKDCIPYGVDVVCLDQPGIVFHLAEFFAARNIEISDLATRRYAAAHTGAPMFSVQMTLNIPGTASIAQLRDEFLDLCEQLNLDSILEPVKL